MDGDRKITLTIGKDGNVEVDVEGVKGPGCLELTKELEDALGALTKQKKKNEFYHVNRTTQTQQVKKG